MNKIERCKGAFAEGNDEVVCRQGLNLQPGGNGIFDADIAIHLGLIEFDQPASLNILELKVALT